MKELIAINTEDDLDKPFLKTITKDELFGSNDINLEEGSQPSTQDQRKSKGKNWKESLKDLNQKHKDN